jgi:hypothetical protein
MPDAFTMFITALAIIAFPAGVVWERVQEGKRREGKQNERRKPAKRCLDNQH